MSHCYSKPVSLAPAALCGGMPCHKLLDDVPLEHDCHDPAMQPPQGLLAALGQCMGMVIAAACHDQGIPYEGMTVEVTADLVDDNRRLDDFCITIHTPQPLDANSRRAVEAAEMLSQVRNTLRHGARVHVTLA